MGQARRHEAPGRADEATAPQSTRGAAVDSPAATFVASHEVLFAPPDGVRCDACGAAIATSDDDDDEGFGVPGEGVYLWARGDEVRFERAPLCASCATAIGMTALARWEIEEEEG